MKIKKKINKKLVIILIISIILLFILGVSAFFFSLSKVSKDDSVNTFTIKIGTASNDIIEELHNNDLIRSSIFSKVLLKLKGYTFMAGTYELKKNMSTSEIFNYLSDSKNNIDNKGITLTFPEGKRVTYYIDLISKSFSYTNDEIKDKINNRDYLDSLINKYWFLTNDIKNDSIYYALEGYLFPDTYNFSKDASLENIIETLLDATKNKLNLIKNEIEEKSYSVHEILTMASIIELEGVTESDRKIISQVIYKRLNVGMALGMDVTTYYAFQIDMHDDLYASQLNSYNAYNTRGPEMEGKLPLGPICNPSLMSIKAALNPSDTDYLYFYADVKTGKVYFTKTLSEHEQIIREVG